MTSDSWPTQFDNEEEFLNLDQAAEEHGFLDVPDLEQEYSSDEVKFSSAPFPRVEGYSIESRIGEGGTSTVYRARQIDTGKLVAIKVLRHQGADSLQLRFRREIQAIGLLDHPGIAKFVDSGLTQESRPYIVLELIDGERIDHYCESKDLSIRERVDIFLDVCEAIAHAHEQSVLHRDLKPANVLVDSSRQPRVTDFGLAKVLQEGELSVADKTRTGAMLGTLNYLAPEQVHGIEQEVSNKTDIFGLGGILHVLLVGCPPFEFRNVVDALASYYDNYPVRLRTDAGIPAGLEAICIKCLSPNPNERYPSVSELMDDLSRFQKGKPVLAKRQLFRRRLQVFSRQYPWFMRAWVAVLITICLIAIAFLGLWQQSSTDYAKAQELLRQRDATFAKLSSTIRDRENDPQTLQLRKQLLLIISENFHSLPATHQNHTEVLFNIAETDFKLGRIYHLETNYQESEKCYERALAGFEELLARSPNHEKAAFGKFHCLLALNKFVPANQVLNQLTIQFPRNEDYQDAAITVLCRLAARSFNDCDYQAADAYLKRGLELGARLDNANPNSIGIRRQCRLDFLSARLSVVRGELANASRLLDQILDQYLGLELASFPTESESEEFFFYARAAMSFALYRGEYETAKTVLDKCDSVYRESREVYQGYSNFRLWYLSTHFEYAYGCNEQRPSESAESIAKIWQGVKEWESNANANNDFLGFVYQFCWSGLPVGSEGPEYKNRILGRLKDIPVSNLPAPVMFGLPRDSDWDMDVGKYLKARLADSPKLTQARWLLSRSQSLPPNHEFFEPKMLSEDKRLRILAQSMSFYETCIEQLPITER